MKPRYLLIAGCPRSGTSALGHLIGNHPNAVIGHERYKHLVRNSVAAYSPHLYERERFFDFRPGDTNQTPDLTPNNRRTYQDAFKKFSKAKLLGDKTPHYYTRYAELLKQMPGAKFVFIFRHIDDVCSSFNRNCDDPHKSWNQNYTHAVANWNKSLENTLLILKNNAERFMILEYERFYNDSDHIAQSLFKFLGLDYPLIRSKYKAACDKYRNDVKNKTPYTKEGQHNYVREHANWEAYASMQSYSAK